MDWQFSPYLLPLLVTTVLSITLLIYALRRRAVIGARPLSAVMLALAIWSFGYMLELAVPDLAAKVFWARFEYFGIVLVPAGWLAFTLEFSGRKHWLTPRNLLLLSLEPALILVGVWTNDLHGWLWRSVSIEPFPYLNLLLVEHSGLFWLNIAYTYLLALVSTALLIDVLRHAPPSLRAQSWAALIGSLAPWVGNLLSLLNLTPFHTLDLTPFAFTVTAVSAYWGLFRFHVLEIIPLAQAAAIESMSDGVLILDETDRLVDLNPAAQALLGRGYAQVIGRPAEEVFTTWPEVLSQLHEDDKTTTEVSRQGGGINRYYEVHVSPFYKRSSRLNGRLVILRETTEHKQAVETLAHDITTRKRAEEALQRQFQELSVLNSIALACVETTAEEALIERATEIIGQTLFTNRFGIYLLDEEAGVLRFNPYCRGIPDEYKDLAIPLGQGITGRVALSGQARLIPDVSRESQYLIVYQPTRSELCVPIKVGERVIGVINAESDQVDAFTEKDERLLGTIAGQLATALDRLRAEAAERRRAKQLSILYQTSQEIVASQDPEQVYAAVHRAVAQLLPCDVLAISLMDEEKQEIYAPYFMEGTRRLDSPRIPAGRGLSGHIIATGETVLIRDLEQEKGYHVIHVGSPPHTRSCLAVPLQISQKVFGALSVQSYQPNAYRMDEQQTLSTLANLVAVAIEKTRLFAETRQHAAHLEALNAVIASAVAAPELTDLMENALDHVLWATGAKMGSIQLAGHAVLRGLAHPLDLEAYFKSQPDLRLLTQGLLVVEDWQADTGDVRLSGLRGQMETHGIRASITILLLREDHPVGSLTVASPLPRQWSPQETLLIESIGSQLSATVERQALLQETRQRLSEVTLLGEVIALTVSAQDITSALNKVCEQLAHFFHVSQAAFALLDPDGRSARVIADYGVPGRPSALGIDIPVEGNPSMAYIVDTKAPLAVYDAQNDPILAPVHAIMRQRQVASILLAPILIGDRIAGTLGIDTLELRQFTPSEINLVQNIARQVGQALERLELFSAAQEQARRMALLAELSASLNRSFSVEEVLESIGRGMMALGQTDCCAIYVHHGVDDIACEWYTGLSTNYIRQVIARAQEMPGAKLLTSAESIMILDVSALPAASLPRSLAQDEGLRTIALWPLVFEGQTIATVGVYHRMPYDWQEAMREVVLAFTRQASVALQNARLFKEAQRRAIQQESLNAIMTAAAVVPDIPTLLDTVLEFTLKALNLERGAVWAAGYRALRQLPTGIGELSANLSKVLEERLSNPLPVEDWEAVGRDDPLAALSEPMARSGVRASLVVPVMVEGYRIGGMALAAPQPHAWQAEEIALAEAVGRQLGSAVERLNLVAKTQAQARQVQQIIDTVPEGVMLLDHDRRLLLANPAARQSLADLFNGKLPGEALSQIGDLSIETLLNSGPAWVEIKTLQAPRRIFEAAAQPLRSEDGREGWVLVLRDVTQERENQARTQMQERLATVGQLAAGIAHDFNNIMAAIVVYADLLLMEPNLSQPGHDRLMIIQQQVQRASSLIRQILDFSRRSVMEQSELDVLPFVKELDKLLGRVLPETIRLELTYAPGSYLVKADPTRLQQAFMNLALNARDAMPSGGVLHVDLSRLQLELEDTPPMPDLSPGNWIRIEVRDTGIGIAPEVRPHIFEPFFTTKPVGQGTGLGLAQVYGIIKQHGGSIDVLSQVGMGTSFIIYLPALALPTELYRSDDCWLEESQGQGETVLLVEDDWAARHALESLLATQNYHVLTAANGNEALQIYTQADGAVQLVVSDIVMPEMGGVELYHALRAHHPDLKVLFLTGHPLSEENQAILEEGQVVWLQKPFSVHEFGRAVRRLIEACVS
jgi:PAS domain S-box-containing protein